MKILFPKSRLFYWLRSMQAPSALEREMGSFYCLNWQNHSIKWTSIYRALFGWSSFRRTSRLLSRSVSLSAWLRASLPSVLRSASNIQLLVEGESHWTTSVHSPAIGTGAMSWVLMPALSWPYLWWYQAHIELIQTISYLLTSTQFSLNFVFIWI